MRTVHLLFGAALAAVLGCEPQSSGEVAGNPDTAITPAIDATAPGNLVVTLSEWDLALSTDTIGAGDLAVQIMNRGQGIHRLEVGGPAIQWVSDSLTSNAETLAQLQLVPGTYELYCPIVTEQGSHRELGMIDTLVVR